METFHLYHLAACWGGGVPSSSETAAAPPLTTGHIQPVISPASNDVVMTPAPPQVSTRDPVIRAAAAHMVYASRTSQAFITPEQVVDLEKWIGMVRQILVGDTLFEMLIELMTGCVGCAD